MSLAEQVQRVDGGQNAALKAIIKKLGGTVPDTTKIDGYAALVNGLTVYDADDQLSGTTKTAYGLVTDATPDEVLAILSKAVLSTSDGDIKLPSGDSVPGIPKLVYGTYVGNDSMNARVYTSGLPYFLIVCGPGGGGTDSSDYTSLVVCRNAPAYRSMSGPSTVAVDVESIVWTDSQVRWSGVGSVGRTLNRGGQTYYYVYAV